MFRWHSVLLSLNVVFAKVQLRIKETQTALKLTVPVSQKTVTYWLFSFKSTKQSHPSDLSCYNTLIGCLWCFFLFLPLRLWCWVGGGGEVMWCREATGARRSSERKPRFTPGWLTLPLYSLFTHTHTHIWTYEHLCAHVHTSVRIHRCARTYNTSENTHAHTRTFRAAYELCTSIPAAV